MREPDFYYIIVDSDTGKYGKAIVTTGLTDDVGKALKFESHEQAEEFAKKHLSEMNPKVAGCIEQTIFE